MPYGTFDDELEAQAPKRAVSGRRFLLSLSQRVASVRLQPMQPEADVAEVAAKEAPASPRSVAGMEFEAEASDEEEQ